MEKEKIDYIKRNLGKLGVLFDDYVNDKLNYTFAKEEFFDIFDLIIENISGINEEKKSLDAGIVNSERYETTANNDDFKIELKENNLVNHPNHYNSGKIECVDAMLDVFGVSKTLAFCELNAFKYLWRSDKKGADIQDKEKAMWYINKYIELSHKNNE